MRTNASSLAKYIIVSSTNVTSLVLGSFSSKNSSTSPAALSQCIPSISTISALGKSPVELVSHVNVAFSFHIYSLSPDSLVQRRKSTSENALHHDTSNS